jgi:GH15 family glucan-1,4-alpha-glucosidase
VLLGNGALTVGLNEQGLVHDFYYPYVGLENLTTARSLHHMIGIWVDGLFSWVDTNEWSTTVNFEATALVSAISMRSDKLALELSFVDFVASDNDVFGRQVTIKNHSDKKRDIRLFMHQVFQISHAGRADTALLQPDENYILDYKGRVTLLIGGRQEDGTSFDQFAVGNYGVEGKEGTFRDAEDGELSGSAIEHAGVDSVIRFNTTINPFDEKAVDYWIIASESQQDGEKIHKQLTKDGLTPSLVKTRKRWNTWLDRSAQERKNIAPTLQDATTKSLLIIKAHIDKRGGVIASCDSSIYNYGRDYYSYVWPRDGAFVLWPLIRLGYTIEAKRFFEFCTDIMHPDGYMMHKYQPDKAIGSTWHPLLHGRHSELAIQEDETAIVLFMMGEFYDYSKDEAFIEKKYATFIKPAADFMCRFIDPQTGLPHASYDLWEEKFMTHTYTTAVTRKALLVAANFAEMFGYDEDYSHWKAAADVLLENQDVFYDSDRNAWRKGFLLNEGGDLTFDNTLDVSSWYGAFMFDYYKDKKRIIEGAKTLETELLNSAPTGGVPRYEYDGYFKASPQYKGNPWFVTTLWLAQYYIRIGRTEEASELIMWCLKHAGSSGTSRAWPRRPM